MPSSASSLDISSVGQAAETKWFFFRIACSKLKKITYDLDCSLSSTIFPSFAVKFHFLATSKQYRLSMFDRESLMGIGTY
jgi:hypothetical protein